MPIRYRIDPERRLVVTRGYGTFTDPEVFQYQQEVWSRAELAWYDELVDMTHVQEIAVPHPDRVRELSELAAKMDMPGIPSKMAILAPDDHAFGLGRMFQAYRKLDPRSKKQVEVFRTLPEAMEFLGLKEAPKFPEFS